VIVGLRHDVDNVYSFRHESPRMVSIEERYGIRSTFFVHVDVVRSGKDQRVLKRLVDGGWEVGLHLINTVGDSRLPSPLGELELLQSFIGQ
jgi:hypothetical protein